VSADSEHIDILRRGPAAWNAWRRQHPLAIPNLTRISLSVSERQMGPMNGGPINLASARLRRASLRFATLSRANLEGADLSGADLTDARLDGVNLSNADLTEATLNHTDFAGARLAGSNLCGADLTCARNLTPAQLAEAVGDRLTALPPGLEAPKSWLRSTLDLVEEQASVAGPPTSKLEVLKPQGSKKRRVSWLIGGPLQTA
jgi:Pentapeptide repeats (8 copies)